MLYMVIERYRPGSAELVYRRFREQGRMLPPGLEYVDSWVETNTSRCFQLMRTDQPELFGAWTAAWNDLVEFEILQVMTSAEASSRSGVVAGMLEPGN